MRAKCTMKNNATLNETVREALGIALLQIMESKPFQSITISEIATVAGVSRNSFYRNYSCKEDLLGSHLISLYQSFFQTVSDPQHLTDPAQVQDFLIPRFRFIKEHRHIFQILHKQHLLYSCFQQTEANLIRLLCVQPMNLSPCQCAMITGACAGTVRYWIDNDFSESEETMARHFTFLFQHAFVDQT